MFGCRGFDCPVVCAVFHLCPALPSHVAAFDARPSICFSSFKQPKPKPWRRTAAPFASSARVQKEYVPLLHGAAALSLTSLLPLPSPPFSVWSASFRQRLFEADMMGQPVMVKERFRRAYRHPVLDHKLTDRRLVSEARALLRARKLGVRVPTVMLVDTSLLRLYLERIPGCTAKQFFQGAATLDSKKSVARLVGATVAQLHSGGMVHGDLTTSNIMVSPAADSVALIDFGLATSSSTAEDKGVDLYVMERAFYSTHPHLQGMVRAVFCFV